MSATTPRQFRPGQQVRFIGEQTSADDPATGAIGTVEDENVFSADEAYYVGFADGLIAAYASELEVWS
jgi:hypothetical protein